VPDRPHGNAVCTRRLGRASFRCRFGRRCAADRPCRQPHTGLVDTALVADPALHALLLRTIDEARRREVELTSLCDDSPAADPARWTAKDHVAHLSAWRRHAAGILRSASAGHAPEEPDDIDERNAVIHAASRGRAAPLVLADALDSYEELAGAIQACSVEQLNGPRHGRPGEVWRVVPGNGHPHVAQHLVQWYREHGDESAAEATARWMRDLDDLFTDRHSRAVAAYNQACFHARVGDVDRALPLLATSLETDPGLREWAAQDPDLDPVRGDAAVRALVGA
jgi:hypothetical protein